MSHSDDNKPWVLIPAYQPDEKLRLLVERLMEIQAFGQVILVNDGSSPEKTEVFEPFRGAEGVTVLDHAVNRGKGQALKTGLNHFLLTAPPETPGIVSCDADGQHLTSDVIKVAETGARENSFTLGVRSLGQGTPFRSKFGNMVTAGLFSLFTGYRLKDTQTGLRYYPRDKVAVFLQTPYDRFDYEFASLVKYVSDHPGQTKQEPIETVYLEANASSHYRVLADSLTIGGVFIRFFFLSLSTAILDYLVFILVFYLTKHIFTSFIAARAIAIIYNFTFSRKLVFKIKSDLFGQLVKYLGLVALFLFISWGITVWLSDILGGYVVLVKAIAEGGLFFISFLVQSRFIFVEKNK
ncbi:MAG: bifunctional glycosyltransferase family 2/GtrA family protein [Deltaproteobacteria bacterium]|jgi:putative flippase GtrA|nr:bifunctional glycosyltransferase family 2/GtrA family protein [Deltaproteobacteria bacterium]